MTESKKDIFTILEKEVDILIQSLASKKLLTSDCITSDEFLKEINQSNYLITVHDVQYYIPICVNNNMRDFYGFKNNWFKNVNHVYYLKTIHPSTYHTLIQSVSFFKKNIFDYLNLEYKLLFKNSEWKKVKGSSKVLMFKNKQKPKYAITVAICTDKLEKNKHISLLTKREKEIISYLTKGWSNKKISEHIHISENTVHTHRKNIYKKIKVRNISELIAKVEDFNF